MQKCIKSVAQVMHYDIIKVQAREDKTMQKYMLSTMKFTDFFDTEEAAVCAFNRLVRDSQTEINHAFGYPTRWTKDIRDEVRKGNFSRFEAIVEIIEGESEEEIRSGFYELVDTIAWTAPGTYHNPEDNEED